MSAVATRIRMSHQPQSHGLGPVLSRVCSCNNGCPQCHLYSNVYVYCRYCNEMECDEPVTRHLYWRIGNNVFVTGSCDKHWESIHEYEVKNRRWAWLPKAEFDIVVIMEADLIV